MLCHKVGVVVEELMDDGAPYKLWSCDLYKCPSCCARIAANFASKPLAEHYQETYSERSPKALFAFGKRPEVKR
jgi:hypothetical protein